MVRPSVFTIITSIFFKIPTQRRCADVEILASFNKLNLNGSISVQYNNPMLFFLTKSF